MLGEVRCGMGYRRSKSAIVLTPGGTLARIRGRKGVSMIELAATLAFAAVMMSVAIPSFLGVLRRNAVVAEANRIVSGLNMARTNAISGSFQSGLCVSGSTTVCSGGIPNQYDKGFAVFTQEESDSDRVFHSIFDMNSDNKVGVQTNAGFTSDIVFDRRGRLVVPAGVQGAEFLVCYENNVAPDLPAISVLVNRSGRITSRRKIAGGCAPAETNF
jgi:Tfp pilus assembly protein FimT